MSSINSNKLCEQRINSQNQFKQDSVGVCIGILVVALLVLAFIGILGAIGEIPMGAAAGYTLTGVGISEAAFLVGIIANIGKRCYLQESAK